MFESELKKYFENKRILILGFGREGRSTYRLIRSLLPESTIGIADMRKPAATELPEICTDNNNVVFHTGDNYLDSLNLYDIVIKSPGIPYKLLRDIKGLPVITSQAELFIKFFKDRIIGVTGTKGKSTTASLVFHILRLAKEDVIFVGNIGVAPFDCIESINNRKWIVYELSSHQLEHIKTSPHISILLNIFQEHLDHYGSYNEYQVAKFNIARYQSASDYFIYNSANGLINELVNNYPPGSALIAFGDKPKGDTYYVLSGKNIVSSDGKVLKNMDKYNNIVGRHNIYNLMAATIACRIAGVNDEIIIEGISTFKGLPHRLEYLGKYNNIDYYNDSIATIPEATIEAINSVPRLATLILGGYDRGVDYSKLAGQLKNSSISNLVLLGNAGKRIYKLMAGNKHSIKPGVNFPSTFDEAVKLGMKLTPAGCSCLLSPAAASYDMFRDFEERGERFRKLIMDCNGKV